MSTQYSMRYYAIQTPRKPRQETLYAMHFKIIMDSFYGCEIFRNNSIFVITFTQRPGQSEIFGDDCFEIITQMKFNCKIVGIEYSLTIDA